MDTVTKHSTTIEILEFDSVRRASTGTTEKIVSMSSHGMTVGDFCYNYTRGTNPPATYAGTLARKKVISITSNKFTVTSSIDGMTGGDVLFLYKFKDYTPYLLQGSLDLTLTALEDNEGEFSMISTYTPPAHVVIFDGCGLVSGALAVFNLTYEYSLNTKVWASKNTYFARRRLAGEGADDVCLLLHGQTEGSSIYNAVDIYRISTDTWENAVDDNKAKTAIQSCYYDGDVYINGGLTTASYAVADTRKYNIDADSWTTLADSTGDSVAGEGILLSNCFMVTYFKDGTAFVDADMFFIPADNVWVNYIVNHNNPDRVFSRAGFTTDGMKGSCIGGAQDVSGSYTGLDNHTQINFPCKVYTELNDIPHAGFEFFCKQYENYAVLAGGIYGSYLSTATISFFDSAYYWNSGNDTWVTIDSIATEMAGGCMVNA